MLLIRKVEIEEIPEVSSAPYKIVKHSPVASGYLDLSREIGELSIVTEDVFPRRFINTIEGVDRWIGMTQDVQDKIGIVFDAFETADLDVRENRRKVKEIKSWNFWKRLKFLFMGRNAKGLC